MPDSVNHSSNYARVAKNTLMLYLRFLVTLFISLFTSRVVLQALGFNDFGLYNVVGGFVSLLAFFNSYISQGTVRFLTFQIGIGDAKRLKDVFAASLALHVAIALIIVIGGETIGLWYVENKLNIQSGREDVAMFVYQLSLVTACLGVMQTPFSACIMAHEDMGIYAYISIFDVAMKLVIVYLLMVVDTDKLQMYALFYFCVSLATSAFYFLFCLKKYQECGFRLRLDAKLYRDMFNYIGWNAIGAVAFTLNGGGVTLLLNAFFGTVVNAARGVAGSVSNIVSQFVFNFQTAMRPQIVKSYAIGNVQEMHKLILYCAKYSSYLFMLFGIPIFLEANTILILWLGKVPPYAPVFVQMTIVQIMVQSVDFPVGYGINAVGRMRLPNITSSLVYLLVLPLCYFVMKLNANPTFAYLISIICFPGALTCDLWILSKYTGFDKVVFLKDVILKTTAMIGAAGFLPLIIHLYMGQGLLRLCVVTISSILFSCLLIYYKGLDMPTRQLVMVKIRKTLLKKS